MKLTPFLRYVRFYRGSYTALVICAVASAGQSFLLLPAALLIRRAFDDAIPNKDFQLLGVIGLIVFIVSLSSEVVTVLIKQRILKITKLATRELRHELLDTIYTLPHGYYGTVEAGRLHATIVQDTERLDVGSSVLIALFLPALFASFALACILAFLNSFLFLLVACTLPILLLINNLTGRSLKKRIRIFHRSFEKFSSGVLFLIQMVHLTRLQSAESFEARRQRANIEDLRQRSSEMVQQQNFHVAAQNTLVVLTGVLVLMVGGWAITMDRMTVGELLSFSVALALLGNQLKTISSTLQPLIIGYDSLNTLLEFLNLERMNGYQGTRRIDFKGGIALESVTFTYGDKPVLKDVSFNIAPHGMIAITGPNGAGKTTIASLILGLYRPQGGRLLADGHPFDELDLEHLRTRIGVVPQEPVIFYGSVLENITYGCPQKAEEEVQRAARIALAHDFIDLLPDGYQTMVGDKGMLLSGGQRQRLAIARALVRQPSLLILDEPTNHLDEETIQHLLANLKEIPEKPATLIISHQKHVWDDAEHIYSVNDDRKREGVLV